MAWNSGILCHIMKLPGGSAAPLTKSWLLFLHLFPDWSPCHPSLVHHYGATIVTICKITLCHHAWLASINGLPFTYRTKSSLLSVDPSMFPILTWNVLSMSLSSHHALHTCSPHFLSSKILHNILFFNLCHYLELRRNSSSSLKPPSISKQEITSHSSRPPLYYIHYL